MKILLVPSGKINPVDCLEGTDTLLRCKKALELWQTGVYSKVLVTGGICSKPKIQTQPAGTLMAQWFEENGVSASDIIIEDQSLDTFENIRLSLQKILDLESDYEITVVTQQQHAMRMWITFLYGYGLLVGICPVKYKNSFKNWLREWGYLLYHLYDRKGTKFLAKKNRDSRRQKQD
ncbi:MAG: YdcF family protein [Patescibacteria group bacterium]|nr:YdcF family protein [Patescibacteria group bacterium]